VGPLAIAAVLPVRRRRRLRRVAFQPLLDDVMVVLLRPEQARERLPRDVDRIRRQRRRQDGLVELVGFGDAGGEDGVERCSELRCARAVQAQLQRARLAGGQRQRVVGRSFRAALRRIDRALLTVDDKAMERVLDVG